MQKIMPGEFGSLMRFFGAVSCYWDVLVVDVVNNLSNNTVEVGLQKK